MLALTLALTLLSAPAEAPRLLAAVPAWGARVEAAAASGLEPFRPGLGAYVADRRAVANWRHEAAGALDPGPLSGLAALFQLDRPIVTRCVKLNNYWCIKRAGWTGEVGFDEEGHTGFASAEQGADAAANLLRRYYLEFGRRSALDIVRRWAPAECRTIVAGTALPAMLAVRGLGNTLRARWLATHRRPQAPRIRLASAGNAIPPLPRTALSSPPARAQAPRAKPAPPRPSRVSAVPERPFPAFRMPSIAAGVGEGKVVTISATLAPRASLRRQPTPASVAAATRALATRQAAPQPAAATLKPQRTASAPARTAARTVAPAPKPQPARSAALASVPARPVTPAAVEVATPAPVPALRPVTSCAADEGRIQNYAARIVQGLGLGPNDDLKLFEPDGRPLPNLARVMLAMSSVELGVLRASARLIDGAVARVALRAQAADAAKPEPDPNATPPI